MENATDSALAEYLNGDSAMRQADLAVKLGIQPPALSKWKRNRVPAERVLDVERLTGIPRWRLRPDIYPQPEAAE